MDYDLGGAVNKLEGVDMGHYPVGEDFRWECFHVSIVAGPEHGHEDAAKSNLPGIPVHDGDGLASPVGKYFLPGAVFMPQDKVQLLLAAPVVLAELGVLVTVRIRLLVFLP